MVKRALLIFAGVLGLLSGLAAAATPAWAHGASPQADLALAQTIAGNELTVVVRRSDRMPGPVRVDVIAHRPVRAMPVTLGLRPANGGRRSTATITLEAGRPGTYPAELSAEHTGPYVLEISAGKETSRLPFQLLVPRAAASERIGYGAFGVASLLLIAALVTGALARRLPTVALGGVAAMAVAVGITAGLLAPQLNPVKAPARPYAQLALAPEPDPHSGVPFTLRLRLLDGATGYPVDDLVPNHAALTHLVVTSQDGGYFRHVHPIRTAPGQWAVRLTADRPGRYLVSVELQRADSGAQLVSGGFAVTGGAPRPTTPAEPRRLRATTGRATAIEVEAGDGVQPWLGMAGHLIVRDEAGDFLGHVHEQLSMRPDPLPPDETVAAYGPTLRFAFRFPEPGRYFAWVQYMRDYEIVTVAYVVEVREGRAEPEPVGETGRTYTVHVGLDAAAKQATVRVEPDARTVDLSAVMPEMGHATAPVAARKVAPGRFEARSDLLGMRGRWELSVRVTGPAGAEIITVPVEVNR